MNIKRYVLPLAVFAVFALAGCGGGGTTTTEPEGPTAAEMAEMERQKADLAAKANALEMALAETLNTPAALQAANDAHMALTAAIAAATDVDTAMYQAQADAAMDTIAAAQKIADAEAEKERMDMAAAEAERMEAEQKALNELAMKLNAAIVVSRTVSGNISGSAGTVSNESYGAGSGVEIHSTPFHIDDDGKPFSDTGNPVVIGDDMVTLQRMIDGAAADAVDRELKLTDTPVASLGGWNGQLYERKNADGEVLDTAVIYTNQGPPTREPFATKHADVITDGRVPNAALAARMPMSSAFRTTPGVKDHQLPASVTTRPNYISIGGTLDGAPGQFRCGTTAGTDVCTSTGTQDGGTTLSAGWYFIADAGAMTSTPDDQYAAFGWWMQEDRMGADGFYVVVRSGPDADSKFIPSNTGGTEQLTAFKALSGKATYNGHAAGIVAIHNPLSSDGNVAADFTADAALAVDFGAVTTGSIDGADARLTGTIDGFMVNGMATDWTVKFLMNDADDAVGGFNDGGGITYRGNTEWSIGDEEGDGMGRYEGVYLNQADSGLPLETVGNFTAQYGSVGSMTGGFGATTTDPDE